MSISPSPNTAHDSPDWEPLLTYLEAGTTLFDFFFRLLGVEVGAMVVETHKIRIEPVVLDTNVIVQDLKRYLRTRRLTAIMQNGRMGLVPLFAATTVREEVPKKLSRLIPSTELAEAQNLWLRDYAPWIRFLDPSTLADLTARVSQLRARDPSDRETGQIIELVCPRLVLSEDPDLAAFGLPGHEVWLTAILAYRDRARRDSFILVLNAGGIRVTGLALQSFMYLTPRLLNVAKKLPAWLQLALGVGVVILLAHPSSHQWLKAKVMPLIQGAKHMGQAMGERLGELDSMAQGASQVIARVQRDEALLGSDVGVIVQVLATKPSIHLLTPTEIATSMIATGYQARSARPEIAVGRVLHRYPGLFEQPVRGHWRLKFAKTDAEL